MCGISCILQVEPAAKLNEKSNGFPVVNGVDHELPDGPQTNGTKSKLATQLNASLDCIEHRGPDSRGQWVSEDERVGKLTSSQLAVYITLDALKGCRC